MIDDEAIRQAKIIVNAFRQRCSIARKKGTRLEYELLDALKKEYPSLAHTFIKGDYHALYDIYTPFCNLDMVSVDSKHRIIVDHKNFCKEHRKYQDKTGIPGFIVFIWDSKYKYLPVDARILKRVARPTIDGYVLNQCKPLPIDPYFSKDTVRRGIADLYIEMQKKSVCIDTNVSTNTNKQADNEIKPSNKPNYADLPSPHPLKHKKHERLSINPNVIHRRNLALFCHR